MTHTQYYRDVNAYFSSASTVLKRKRYQHSHKRLKAAYNAAKSLAIARFMVPKGRILDIGCGKGSELLKFGRHRPEFVVFMDLSAVCLSRVKEFSLVKGIKYPLGLLQGNAFTDDISQKTTLVQKKTHVPRRVRLTGLNVVTTFSVLEYCPDMRALHTLCNSIATMLSPGGAWIGCTTDGTKLMERCNNTGYYEDFYCKIQLQPDSNQYQFQSMQNNPRFQYSWALPTIVAVAAQHGLVLGSNQSLLNVLANSVMDKHYKQIRHGSQLNGKYKLQLDDFRPLSLLTFFTFHKPASE